MIQMFTVRNTPQDSFEASMEVSQKHGLMGQARNLLALLPMIYVLTLMWWIPEGAKYVPGVTLFSLLFYPLLGGRFEREEQLWSGQKLLLFGLWGMVAIGVLVYALNGTSWSELRAWLTGALYLAVFRGIRVDQRLLVAVLVVSACGFGVQSLYQYSVGVFRVHGFINPIPYAVAAGSVSLVCLVQAVFGRSPSWQRVLLGVSGLLAAVAVMLTRTRGVIVPFVAILGGALAVQYILNHRGKVSRSLMVGLLAVFGLVALGGSLLEGRIQQTFNEYSAIDEGNYRGSIGVRLQLWLAASELVTEAPVLGHGSGYRDALGQLHEQGKIEDSLYRFGANHFHNQYVDTLIKKGLVGLAVLGLLLWAAVRLAIATPSGDWRRYAGLAITLLFATAALTDVPLLHADTIFLFIALTIAVSVVGTPRNQAFEGREFISS